MKMLTKIFLSVSFLLSAHVCGWADEGVSKENVTNLVAEIQTIAKSDGAQSQYAPVLRKYLDFTEITRRVLAGVRKKIKEENGPQAAKTSIESFLPKFIPVFTTYIIKKYSDRENINKFKSMTFELNRVDDNGKYFMLHTTFKSDSGSLGDVKVDWQTAKNNDLVVDMVFTDAAASFFKNEQSEATAKYEKVGSLDALLNEYQ